MEFGPQGKGFRDLGVVFWNLGLRLRPRAFDCGFGFGLAKISRPYMHKNVYTCMWKINWDSWWSREGF